MLKALTQLLYIFNHLHDKQKDSVCIANTLNKPLLIKVEPFMSFCPSWAVKAPVGVVADPALLTPSTNRLIITKLVVQKM